jgi:NhaP-type Na+/H+ or K+/H+ antiporter
MDAPSWYVLTGAVLGAMALGATLIRRLPLSTSIFYLLLGWLLGPHGFAVIDLRLDRDAAFIEHATEAIILISLFSAGLKLRLPLRSRAWLLSARLAGLSMLMTVAIIAAGAVVLLDLTWPLAILLGGMLAPTDPVLASQVQVDDPFHMHALRFGLTSEAGLNDGSAFPFVMLGLALLAGPFPTSVATHWLLVDVVWGIGAGLGCGFGIGLVVGTLVLHLRRVHRQAVGLGYFLAPGLMALAYGIAQLAGGYGFLSVFSAAVALRWIEMRHGTPENPPDLPLVSTNRGTRFEAATNPNTAPIFLVELLLQFTMQIEQLGEAVIVTIVGILLSHEGLSSVALPAALLVLVIARPPAVFASLLGTPLRWSERALIAWFGIRGIGSLYYLAYAAGLGMPANALPLMTRIVTFVIAASITVHGISVTPLMHWYERHPNQRTPMEV